MRIGKWVGLGGRILGAFIVATPAIKAWSDVSGNISAVPERVLYNYTGVALGNKTFDASQTVAGVGAVLGGIAVSKIFSYVARSL